MSQPTSLAEHMHRVAMISKRAEDDPRPILIRQHMTAPGLAVASRSARSEHSANRDSDLGGVEGVGGGRRGGVSHSSASLNRKLASLNRKLVGRSGVGPPKHRGQVASLLN